jgi:hypothetical protein
VCQVNGNKPKQLEMEPHSGSSLKEIWWSSCFTYGETDTLRRVVIQKLGHHQKIFIVFGFPVPGHSPFVVRGLSLGLCVL